MVKKTFLKFNINQRGFTLLFAVLVSTLVLAVGASIISLALKQVQLSGTSRDSQYAFYAANTGYECAYYWDVHGYNDKDLFPINNDTNFYYEPGGTETDITCLSETDSLGDINRNSIVSSGDPVNWIQNPVSDPTESSPSVTSFSIRFDEDEVPYCADVTVSKWIDSDDNVITTIDSRGYNTCDEDNPRRIERGLELTY